MSPGSSARAARSAALAVVLCALAPAARAETLVLAADPYCPYNCIAEERLPGFMVDIAAEALAEDGHKVEYRVLPWSRALSEARAGRVAGAIGVGIGDGAGLVLHLDEPAAETRQMVLSRSGEVVTWQGTDTFAGRRLGVIADYSHGETIDRYVNVHRFKSDAVVIVHGDDALERILRLMLAGRIDLAVSDFAVTVFATRRLGLSREVAMVPTGRSMPLFVGFSPERPDAQSLARRMVSSIRTMRRTGRLASILSRYGLVDWAHN